MRARFVATLPCVLVVVVALGCGDNLPGPASSGSRLALHTWVFEDATELVDPTRFRDLARAEECAPALWSDGARYCTPAAGDLVYADPQCLTEVAHVPAGLDAGYFVKPFFAGREKLISRLVRLGDPFGTTSVTYHLEGGTCVGAFESTPGALYTTGGIEETSEAFVRVRRSVATGDGRFEVERETSDDGMTVPVGFLDAELGIDCVIANGHDAAQAPCVPRSQIAAQYFTDDTCRVPVASTSSLATADAIEADVASCPHYFAIGDEVPSTDLWDGSPGACFSTVASMGPRYLAAGAELAIGTVSRTAIATSKRLELVALADPAFAIYDRYVHDLELDIDCTPSMLAGTVRCLPASAPRVYVMTKFTDATCGTAIEIAYVPSAPCEASPSYAVSGDGALHHLGGVYDPVLYERSTSEICAPAPVPAGTVPHVLGNPLPDSTFAAVTAAP